MTTKPQVSIVMGSDSDLEIMQEAAKALREFGVEYEIDVTSAHRSPERTAEYACKAAARGIRIIIAGAGGAALGGGVEHHNRVIHRVIDRGRASADGIHHLDSAAARVIAGRSPGAGRLDQRPDAPGRRRSFATT